MLELFRRHVDAKKQTLVSIQAIWSSKRGYVP